jgi:prepilin-type N-terminal cleavage/methylation domain-containing protein
MKRNGFTLLEIVLVVALLSIMVLAAVPMISRIVPDVGLESEAKKIKAAIIYTQQQAVLTGSNHKIVFDIQQQRYSIQKINDSNWAISEEMKSLQHGVSFKTINFANYLVEFNPMGEPMPEGGSIALTGTNNAVAIISVASTSGIVTISTGSGHAY